MIENICRELPKVTLPSSGHCRGMGHDRLRMEGERKIAELHADIRWKPRQQFVQQGGRRDGYRALQVREKLDGDGRSGGSLTHHVVRDLGHHPVPTLFVLYELAQL